MKNTRRPVVFGLVLLAASVFASMGGSRTALADPRVPLTEAEDLVVRFAAGDPAEPLEQGRARPLSLAAGDFNEDGVPDLVAGFGTEGGGLVALHLGNVDALFPNRPAARERAAARGAAPPPFLSPARVFALAEPAAFLGAGDFDADGHLDVVAAAREGRQLYLLPGDGRGEYGPARTIVLDGTITAFASGEINQPDGLADVVVAIRRQAGPQVLVFESPDGALDADVRPEAFDLPAEAHALALGRMTARRSPEGAVLAEPAKEAVTEASGLFANGPVGSARLEQGPPVRQGLRPQRPQAIADQGTPAIANDLAVDLAVGTDHHLVLIEGRPRYLSLDSARRAGVPPASVSARLFPFAIVGLAVGDFAGDGLSELALASDHGAVYRLGFTGDELASLPLEARAEASVDLDRWTELEPLDVESSLGSSDRVLLAPASLSPRQATSLLVAAPNARQLRVLPPEAESSGGAVELDARPAAMLPMHLNADALTDLVMLVEGQSAPAVMQSAAAMVFTVTHTGNSGAGSLRDAITQANANPGADTIDFSIASGAQTITPLSALPTITEAVTIDGTTQPGFAGTPLIQLVGTSAGASADGLKITAPNCLIRGLRITGFGGAFAGNGILISGAAATGNQVQGCHIVSNNDDGLEINTGARATVGGTVTEARNVISGNKGDGIYISGPGGTALNVVQGNFIGTDASGTLALPNGNFGEGFVFFGIEIAEGSQGNIIGGTAAGARNVLSGNASVGVGIFNPGSSSNLVQGNYIGTDVTGALALGNRTAGVTISFGGFGDPQTDNLIGGTVPSARNVISGNVGDGVFVAHSGIRNNLVQGNYIGLNAAGTAKVPNTVYGVEIAFGAQDNTVGGTAAGSRNVASGNDQAGVVIFNPGSTGNVVQGNYLGTNPAGTGALGNGAAGAAVAGGAQSNRIGGTDPGAGNLISGGAYDGVLVTQWDTNNNQVVGNLIGTDATGTTALGNGFVSGGWGIEIAFGARSNTISGNVISGNREGLLIANEGTNSNIVRGNFVGTRGDGVTPVPNNGHGVYFGFVPGTGNVVGGPGGQPETANVIAYNGGAGVYVDSGVGANAFRANAIYSNSSLGIDLDGNFTPGTVNSNDHCDPDAGPNSLQNQPVLSVAAVTAGSTLVRGTLDSTASTSFAIEFFSTPSCDASGSGEGKTYLGSVSVPTSAGCGATIDVALSTVAALGSAVTATATSPAGATSEFSNCVTVVACGSETWYRDMDGDGFGDSASTVIACLQPAGYSASPTDCNDTNAAVFPGAPQICDGLNNDCADPTWPAVPATDADADQDGVLVCEADCDDGNPAVFPGAAQVCDGVNNDCNDAGWPALNGTNEADDDADLFTECQGDCDDAAAGTYPGAPQLCGDGLNTDCDHPSWPSLVGTNEGDNDFALTESWAVESDQENAALGASVAAAGDVNGDGFADVVVGLPTYSGGEDSEGQARLYLGSATGLSPTPSWSAESDQSAAWFGTCVAGAGDVNGDGFDDVVVGAPRYDAGQTNEGRAFLYLGSPTGLTPMAAWTAESNGSNAEFGAACAGAGDVNQDGFDDVVIGAPKFSGGQSGEGRAVLYLGSANGLATTAAWTAESNQTSANFGASVAGAGDVNGDAFDDVVIGAPLYDGGQSNEGAVYVYHGQAGGLGASATRMLEGNQAGADFGRAVASAGDVNGDGFTDVLIGAPLHDGVQAAEGRAYVYLGSESGVAAVSSWIRGGDAFSARFGSSVAALGDLDGNGHRDVIVGARRYSDGESQEGRVLVYLGSASGLGTAATWTLESNVTNAELGSAVAGVGDLDGNLRPDIVIGAAGYTNEQNGEGRVLAFLAVGDGRSECAGDCDDGDAAVYPGAPQICDALNNDCGDAAWPSLAGTNESDDDGDGFSECSEDCDDANAAAWSPPGEALDLTLAFDIGGGVTTFGWTPPASLGGAPVAYDLLRSSNAADFGASAVCVEANDGSDTLAMEAQLPGPGEVWFYLARAENACPGQGSLGAGSNGMPRSGRDCP